MDFPEGYIPTNVEKQLLDVLLDPEYATETVTRICEVAGVARATYYNCMQRPDFVAYYNAMSVALVKQALGPVINAMVHEAKKGSFTHGKLILDMAGIVTERPKQISQSIDANVNGTMHSTLNIIIDGGLPDDTV